MCFKLLFIVHFITESCTFEGFLATVDIQMCTYCKMHFYCQFITTHLFIFKEFVVTVNVNKYVLVNRFPLYIYNILFCIERVFHQSKCACMFVNCFYLNIKYTSTEILRIRFKEGRNSCGRQKCKRKLKTEECYENINE